MPVFVCISYCKPIYSRTLSKFTFLHSWNSEGKHLNLLYILNTYCMIQINKCKEYLFQSLFISIKDVNIVRYYATIENKQMEKL